MPPIDMSKITQESSANQLAKAYRDGATLTELSRLSHRSVAAVRQALVTSGVPIRRKGGLAPVDTDQRTTEMQSLYEEGKTLQEIGDKFGLTRERVRQVLREAGVESHGRRDRSAPDLPLTAQEKKIARLYDKGTAPGELLSRFDINYSMLQNILKRADVDIKPKGFFNRRPGYEKIKDGIIRDYKKGEDTGIIADRYGLCGRTEIYKFIKREGIAVRYSSEAVDVDNQKVISQYNSGATMAKLARDHGVSASRIRNILVSGKVAIRHRAKREKHNVA